MNAPLRHPVAVLKERPFDGRLRILSVDWAAERTPSIAEILDAQSDLSINFRAMCVARVNGELVPRELWHLVRPKRNPPLDVVVTFTLPLGNPGGSGGGGSSSGGGHKSGMQTAATVGTIAVLLAATAISAGALGPLAASLGATGGFLGASSVSAAILGAGVGIGGNIERCALEVRA